MPNALRLGEWALITHFAEVLIQPSFNFQGKDANVSQGAINMKDYFSSVQESNHWMDSFPRTVLCC